ncbi:alpha/beta fold hydrolase [Martelella alba]|uniref:Alpha/beta fold hydrolase n=1 Tax=Martelella alba TaxID=2590451 RepID=A0A506UJJ3_9HYPH|nr:alpha/beta fold hydrolase [Martelella alba]TPW33468.1 alpha/beta fold hydrolase [Martelella alba]
MKSRHEAFLRHAARLAEIPRLLKPATLPGRWEQDPELHHNADRGFLASEYFYAHFHGIELPSALYDRDGERTFSNAEECSFPPNLGLPLSDSSGINFREHNGVLILLLDLNRRWKDVPDGLSHLAVVITRSFLETIIARPDGPVTLTEGEYRLLTLLLSGLELKQAAIHLGAAYNTKRKQLQVIFQKFNVSGQTALLQAVSFTIMGEVVGLVGRSGTLRAEQALLRRHFGGDVLFHDVALSGGDRLPVWEFGQRRGRPCLFFHPLLTPAIIAENAVSQMKANGLRWIVAPRFFSPAANEPDPVLHLERYSAALADFIEHFIGEPVDCVGASSGAAWLGYFARHYPHLVRQIVIAGMPHPPTLRAVEESTSLQSSLSDAMRHNPKIVSTLVRAYSVIARTPALAARAYRLSYRHSPPDLAVIDYGIQAGFILDWLKLLGERGGNAIAADLLVNQRDWVSELLESGLPITLVHGEQDAMCRPEVVHALHARRCDIRTHILPDAGHHLVASHFNVIANILSGTYLCSANSA